MLRILTLMDNKPSENKALRAEHGLSFWVEAGGLSFLFDCGAGEATMANAHRLGVDLGAAAFTICSHSHYDHAAGFRDIAEHGWGGGLLYTGAGFWQPKYAWDGLRYTNLSAGFDEGFLKSRGIRHEVCGGLLEIADGCWLVGDFPRVHSFETIPQRFVKGEPPSSVPDDFSDEICLAVRTEKGLVVLVGCSHPGILNMMSKVHSSLGLPICAVFGGTHLVEAGRERIETTVEELRSMGLSILGLSHCSGQFAEECVRSDGRVQACHMAAGDCVAFR